MQKPYTSYNLYFFIPVLFWVLLGGIALLNYDSRTLFSLVNMHYTATTDLLMYYITMLGEGVISGIVLLLLLFKRTFRNWWYFAAAVLSNALPPFIIQTVKHSVQAPRPLNYFKEADWIHTLPEWPRLMNNSFPSGHTCAAFCFFTLVAILLRSGYKWVGFLFFALAILVAYSRLYLAAHFFIDVYVGSILGVIFTVLIIFLLNKYQGYFFKQKD
ncbi:MAG: phosphatase PAP2 family protein [Sphingobacteriales bacterium]|nr:MAG: phosphatase PAP2 family protein [Sphingobacteriales bacterium]